MSETTPLPEDIKSREHSRRKIEYFERPEKQPTQPEEQAQQSRTKTLPEDFTELPNNERQVKYYEEEPRSRRGLLNKVRGYFAKEGTIGNKFTEFLSSIKERVSNKVKNARETLAERQSYVSTPDQNETDSQPPDTDAENEPSVDELNRRVEWARKWMQDHLNTARVNQLKKSIEYGKNLLNDIDGILPPETYEEIEGYLQQTENRYQELLRKQQEENAPNVSESPDTEVADDQESNSSEEQAEVDSDEEERRNPGGRLRDRLTALITRLRNTSEDQEDDDIDRQVDSNGDDETEEAVGVLTRLRDSLRRSKEKVSEHINRINENLEQALIEDREQILAAVQDESAKNLIEAFASNSLTPEQIEELDVWEENYREDNEVTVDQVITLLMTNRIGYSWKLRSFWKEHEREIEVMHNRIDLYAIIEFKKNWWLNETRQNDKKRWLNTKVFNGLQSLLPFKVPIDKYGRPNLNGKGELNEGFTDKLRNNLNPSFKRLTTEGKPGRVVGYILGVPTFLFAAPVYKAAKVAFAVSPWAITKIVDRATNGEINSKEDYLEYLEERGERGRAAAKSLRWASAKATQVAESWIGKQLGDVAIGGGEAARVVLLSELLGPVLEDSLRKIKINAGSDKIDVDLGTIDIDDLESDNVGNQGELNVSDANSDTTSVEENISSAASESAGDTELPDVTEAVGERFNQTQEIVLQSGENPWDWYAQRLGELDKPTDNATVNALKNATRKVGMIENATALPAGKPIELLNDDVITNISSALQETMQKGAQGNELREVLLQLGPNATQEGLSQISTEQVQEIIEAAAAGNL